MNPVRIIEKKRDGKTLNPKEIQWMIQQYDEGSIPDYQMAALLMAIYYQGMNDEEIWTMTCAMAASGDTIDLSSVPGIKVDKHSTGGVGDTVTLAALPLAAAAGVTILKMSGRALGITGGTADKLESIPGYRTALPEDQMIRQVQQCRLAMVTQSSRLAPADGQIYSLRDATATVESIPLIAASIMSKKIVSGSEALILDVKCGRGAFMKDVRQAEELARILRRIGNLAGLPTTVFLTDMTVPLGQAIGNSVEVDEAVEVLRGRGSCRLRSLCIILAGAMIKAGGVASSQAEGEEKAKNGITSGSGLEQFKQCIEAQGGDTQWIDKGQLTPKTRCVTVYAQKSGYITDIDPVILAETVIKMGGGRMKKGDPIDHFVGLRLRQDMGTFVHTGDPLLNLYMPQGGDWKSIESQAESAVRMGENPRSLPLIYKMWESDNNDLENQDFRTIIK